VLGQFHAMLRQRDNYADASGRWRDPRGQNIEQAIQQGRRSQHRGCRSSFTHGTAAHYLVITQNVYVPEL
jgi:hypothetical protein